MSCMYEVMAICVVASMSRATEGRAGWAGVPLVRASSPQALSEI